MKSSTRKIILSLCIAACLAFIWINSLMPAEVSGEMSGFAEKILRYIFGEELAVGEAVLRKLAHCTEFAVYGFVLALFMYEKLTARLPLIAFCGLGTAVMDETIQLFSDGRAGQIKDVWIDFSGFAAGVLFVFLLYAADANMKGTRKQ